MGPLSDWIIELNLRWWTAGFDHCNNIFQDGKQLNVVPEDNCKMNKNNNNLNNHCQKIKMADQINMIYLKSFLYFSLYQHHPQRIKLSTIKPL